MPTLKYHVRCSKCGVYEACDGHDGTFIPRTPKGWIGLHSVSNEVNVASDFLGFVCKWCKGDVLATIAKMLAVTDNKVVG